MTGELLLKKDIVSYDTEQNIITNNFNNYQSIVSNTLRLNDKANQSTTYSKAESDALLNAKANQTTTYTIAQDDAFLNAKANQTTTYTKSEVDGIIDALIDSAPIARNQLSELAAALDNDANYATNVNNLIATKANQNTTYTITQADTLINAKANQTTTYTKTEDDGFLNAKANQNTTYTITHANTLLNAKANQTTTYTKNEVDGLLTSSDWVTQSGDYNYLDSNVGGLIITSNEDTAVQILGSCNTGAEGDIIMYKNATIGGNLTITGNIQCTGTNNFNPYHIAMNVLVSGVINTQSGIHNATVTKEGGDSSYLITFPAHPLVAQYIVLCSSNEYHTVYRSATATSLILYCRSSTNSSANEGGGAFSIVILA